MLFYPKDENGLPGAAALASDRRPRRPQFENRQRRGYLFIIGDEAPYPKVKRQEVKQVIGDGLQTDLRTENLLAELERRYDVYYIIPRMTNH